MSRGLLFFSLIFMPIFLLAQDFNNSNSGDILINEVMANPVGLTLLPETEYVEIYNASGSDLSLNGWVFVYDGKETALPDTILLSGSYAVLYRSGRDMTVADGSLSLGIDKFPSALANTSKTIGLKNSKGEVIDEITYPNATAGKSYERSDDATWHVSTDEKGGTPGAVNSNPQSPDPNPDPDPPVPPVDNSKSGDILINEVMANPVGLTLLPETEYVEIYNTSGGDLSLNGWTFVYDGKETSLPDTVLLSGGYAVLYRSGRDMIVADGSLSLGIDRFPSALANTSKTIGLKNSKGEVIDEITYPNAIAGKSYERSGDGTWHVSTDEKGGTPGAVNSSSQSPDPNPDPNPDPDPPVPPVHNSKPGDILINEVMANPVGLTLLPETEYVEIYNVSGGDLSLNGWVFVYDGKETSLPDTVLLSGSYAVLYRAGRDIVVADGSLSLGIDKFPSALANTSKTIGLKNSKGEVIDEITYPNATAGKSYERSDDATWHVSTDEKGGTPGAVNSNPQSPDPNPDPDPPVPPVDNSKSGDILINEVMANPVGLTLLPETEYVEIYNTSGGDLSLNGWTFVYDGKETSLPDTVLFSGGYAVLYRAGRDMIVADGSLSLGIDKFPSALANTSKRIGLKNSKGEVIDEITYPNAIAGKSYERSNDGTWHVSADEKGGTPGAVNSSSQSPDPNPNPPVDNSKSGDVLINEVMANPVGLTLLPETEYVEIYNASGSNISLNGWVFIYDGKETSLPNTVLLSGGYAVLYRAGRDIVVADGGLSLGIDKFPSALANASKTIGLKNSKGEVIDEITYPNAAAGKSYERSDDGTWHVSTDEKGGTPGAVNSLPQSPDPNPDPNPDPDPPVPSVDNSNPGDILINEVMANPVGLTLLPETEYVEIYNASESDISLNSWVFVYDGKETSLPDTVLLSGGYAVLYRSGRDMIVADGSLSLGIDKFPSALANTSKTIGLKNSKGEVIDEITYPNAIAGKSYERSDDGTWHISIDEKGGTPGAVNSSSQSPDPNPDPNPDPPVDNSSPGDILINEVMANPVGLTLLPETEYVEIYNVSGGDLSLNGWVFVYDGKETALPDTVLLSGGYAVLYRAGRDMIVADGSLSLGIDKFPSALANTSKTIGLKNSKGEVIDEITYPDATAGKSYERSDDATWHVSTDEKGGTPGAVNSPSHSPDPDPKPTPDPDLDDLGMAEPFEIIINEILPDPFAGGSEYIELYNRSDRSISLSGLAIAVRKADGSLSTHYSLNSVEKAFSPEGFLVLTKEYSGVADFYFMPAMESLYELKLPALNNEGASVVLFRISDEVIIDEVSYSTKWHDSSIKDKKGVSLERKDPDGNSQDALNWTSAAAEVGYGTPGYRNSQYKSSDTQDNTYINAPEYMFGLDFYSLTYQTMKAGFRCRVEVYSTNGKKVAEISNNQLLTQSGELRWDGKGLDNNRLSPGVYVFYAELYHPEGNQKKFKKAFLVK